MLKFCYVPVTSACSSKGIFVTATNLLTRQAVYTNSIYNSSVYFFNMSLWKTVKTKLTLLF